MRADLDALLRKAFPANAPRWYTWDGNGGGTFLPNGIPDGHEFYCRTPLGIGRADT